MQKTLATRNDAKGRHTTTACAPLKLETGACIIDVPGMREIGLAPSEGGVGTHFHSLAELAGQCRFANCTHQQEPGCAVRKALEKGEVDEDKCQHYLKLLAEERHNVAAYKDTGRNVRLDA